MKYLLLQKDNNATVSFQNIIYKQKNVLNPAPITSFQNVPPAFDSINAGRRLFNFRLKDNSPAVNKGTASGVTIDLDGNPRDALPDIGCYEKQ